MHFSIKNYLKNNRYYTIKHTFMIVVDKVLTVAGNGG